MAQAELKVDNLPAEPLDAAAAFHADHLNSAIAALEGGADQLTIILPPSRQLATGGCARSRAKVRAQKSKCAGWGQRRGGPINARIFEGRAGHYGTVSSAS